MFKSLFSVFCLAGGLLLATSAGAATPDVSAQKIQQTVKVSTGHNLNHAGQQATATQTTKIKTLDNTQMRKSAAKKGLSVKGPQPARREAGIDHSSAALWESFESCENESAVLPEGWTSISTNETAMGDLDKWIGVSKEYSLYYGFPLPTDGDKMIACFYNDDEYKDEWLVSPEFDIPSADYTLSWYWYTVPYYLYVIDSAHVDFEEGKFIERELLYNVEVLVRAEGEEEWTKVYDFEQQFRNVEFTDLFDLIYDDMQQAEVSLANYAGKKIQVAFRYFGEGGNSWCLDAVSVDVPHSDVLYSPYYSRLFYGYTADEDGLWMPASIEFYPVNAPLYWFNESPDDEGTNYHWTYSALGENGELVEQTCDDPDMLEVVYTPDYTDSSTLMNNFYLMPKLHAESAEGGISTYGGRANFLQAGGAPEFVLPEDEGGYRQFTAMNYDILTEGLVAHYEESEELGFFAEPIFGYSVNTDTWWKHYSFPEGFEDEDYSYVEGFANLFFPHPGAPMVVKGVSAMALGTIYDEAQFTMKIYAMDDDGVIIEEPVAEKTIAGKDVLDLGPYLTQHFLTLNFPLDEPVVLSTEGTGYGYIVEISGYHDPNITFFCPLQSLEPNEYEWCLGFYHHKMYSSRFPNMDRTLTEEMSYVAFFKDFQGRDMYSSFAIGLDACYPWLEATPDAEPVVIDGKSGSFKIRSYYNGSEMTVEAPEWLQVTVGRRYSNNVKVTVLEQPVEDTTVPVTIKAPGCKDLTVNVQVKGSGSGVESLVGDDTKTGDVYNMQGIKVGKELQNLPAGIYIKDGKKVLVKH